MGYSSSDIKIVVKDILYEPIRKIRESKYFKNINGIWEICQKEDIGSTEIDKKILNNSNMVLPKIDFEYMKKSILSNPSSVDM